MILILVRLLFCFDPLDNLGKGLSLEELGLRALQHIPRDRAIDGIRAFMDMR